MIKQIEPIIGDKELKEVTKVIKSTQLTESNKTKEFERRFGELVKSKYCVAYSNCTAALFSALKLLKIGPGDEVIVPNLTFIASVNSITLTGAKAILCDVNPYDATILTTEIEKLITKNTKAIMPVHLYGSACDMDRIMEIARINNLYVIEDVAQGVGVKYKGKYAGTFGDYGCFSFYGNKTITTGEGGMLITNNKKRYMDALMFKQHGRKKRGTFIHPRIGFNFSITDIQSAIGIAQLSRLKYIIKRKKEINDLYREYLSPIDGIAFLHSEVYWFTNILTSKRSKLSTYLNEKGIQTRRFFYPMNKQPCYKCKRKFINSDYFYDNGLSLPSSVNLTDKQIIFISEKIRGF